jgi:DNA/RNA-binding domain of Phe-tRNA-synthetase-like protein
MDLIVDEHPYLLVSAFTSRFEQPLGASDSPDWLRDLLRLDAGAPIERLEQTRSEVRDMLRWGGYKPTGRGKPASEYLVRAAGEGTLGSINAAVDACNAVSLHSALPISLIDTDRANAPLRIAIARPGSSYVFNASGQTIDLEGLLCVHDTEGPCANAVKDSQRTKTSAETRNTLSVIWGVRSRVELLAEATLWYREIVERLGGVTEEVIAGAP